MTDDELWNKVRDPPMHFDRLGVPISLREWAQLQEDEKYRRIGSTWVGRWWISTLWVGIDHNWYTPPGGVHIPIIFETMVFDRNGTAGEDWEIRRYSTEEQAREGHEEMVQLVQTLENVDPGRTQARLDDLP